MSCEHLNWISERGIATCVDCGEEIDTEPKEIIKDSEKKAPVRKYCEDTGVLKDLTTYGINQNIAHLANQLYITVSNGKIYRGDVRKSILVACVYHVYKVSGDVQSHERLATIFGISVKCALKGLKHLGLAMLNKKTSSPVKKDPIVITSIREILKKFSGSKDQENEIIEMYHRIENKSSELNRCRPQSIAAGLIFHWSEINGKNISKKDFALKVNLSEMTINKVLKEIQLIFHK